MAEFVNFHAARSLLPRANQDHSRAQLINAMFLKQFLLPLDYRLRNSLKEEDARSCLRRWNWKTHAWFTVTLSQIIRACRSISTKRGRSAVWCSSQMPRSTWAMLEAGRSLWRRSDPDFWWDAMCFVVVEHLSFFCTLWEQFKLLHLHVRCRTSSLCRSIYA